MTSFNPPNNFEEKSSKRKIGNLAKPYIIYITAIGNGYIYTHCRLPQVINAKIAIQKSKVLK